MYTPNKKKLPVPTQSFTSTPKQQFTLSSSKTRRADMSFCYFDKADVATCLALLALCVWRGENRERGRKKREHLREEGIDMNLFKYYCWLMAYSPVNRTGSQTCYVSLKIRRRLSMTYIWCARIIVKSLVVSVFYIRSYQRALYITSQFSRIYIFYKDKNDCALHVLVYFIWTSEFSPVKQASTENIYIHIYIYMNFHIQFKNHRWTFDPVSAWIGLNAGLFNISTCAKHNKRQHHATSLQLCSRIIIYKENTDRN